MSATGFIVGWSAERLGLSKSQTSAWSAACASVTIRTSSSLVILAGSACALSPHTVASVRSSVK